MKAHLKIKIFHLFYFSHLVFCFDVVFPYAYTFQIVQSNNTPIYPNRFFFYFSDTSLNSPSKYFLFK